MTIKQFLLTPVRIAFIAYGFLQFAIQVIWLGKWQMPRIIKKAASKTNARSDALYMAHRHVVRYLATMEFLRLIEFRFEGQPHNKPCIVAANHPSLIDFIVLLRDLPNTVCLFKAESRNNPVLSSFLKVGGYIEGFSGTTASGNKRIINATSERLKEGHHVTFFPEGTRSESATTIRKFRTMAFHAAIKSQKPVQPVVILCQPLFLGKNQNWLDFTLKKNLMTVRYLPPIYLHDLPKEEQTAIGFSLAVRKQISIALAEIST